MEMITNYKESRPWGEFENLLDIEYCKVKRITIHPGESPSYQYHYKRSETWVIIKGIGDLILDGKMSKVSKGDTILVPVGTKHQIQNNSNKDLIFIEVQYGEYFGEDDIVRLKDKYER